MTATDSSHEWNGSALSDTEVSLAVFSVPVMRSTIADRALLLAAACGGGQIVVVWPDQIGQFLCAHADRTIICHDAGYLHWLVQSHLYAQRNPQAAETLWAFSRNSRLADVMLLDQLVQLADHASGFPAARPLHELATEILHRSLDDVASVELRLQSAIAENGPPSANLIDEILETASVTKLIFSKLKYRAVELAGEHGIDLQTVATFGPLGLGIEVKAAIAVAAARRHSLHVDPDAVEPVIETCNALFQAGAHLLYDNADARQCFRTRNDRREFRLSNRGFLQPRRERLRNWLSSIQRQSVGPDGLYPPGVFYDAGDFVVIPDEYGIRADCNRFLYAWSDCEGAARVRDLARTAPNDGVRPEYEIIPRLAARKPSLPTVRRIARGGLFEAGHGRQLLVAWLPELELRSLATVLERRAGATRLAADFHEGRSPTLDLANRLAGQFERKRDTDLIDEQSHWATIATTAVEAIALRLGKADLMQMIRSRTGRPVGLSDVSAFEGEVLAMFPELTYFKVDRTYAILANRLRVSVSECEAVLRDRNGELPPPAELKKLFFGLVHELDPGPHPRGHPGILRRIRQLNRNPELNDLLLDEMPSEGMDELPYGVMCEQLLGEQPVVHTGRVRYRACPSSFDAEYLDIADAVVKSVLFALVEAGLGVVGFNGQEIAVEVAVEEDLDARMARIKELAVRASATILTPVPAECICQPRRRW